MLTVINTYSIIAYKPTAKKKGRREGRRELRREGERGTKVKRKKGKKGRKEEGKKEGRKKKKKGREREGRRKKKRSISEAKVYKHEEQQALLWLLPELQRMRGDGSMVDFIRNTFYIRLQESADGLVQCHLSLSRLSSNHPRTSFKYSFLKSWKYLLMKSQLSSVLV